MDVVRSLNIEKRLLLWVPRSGIVLCCREVFFILARKLSLGAVIAWPLTIALPPFYQLQY
jgi:hypothetical protein